MSRSKLIDTIVYRVNGRRSINRQIEVVQIVDKSTARKLSTNRGGGSGGAIVDKSTARFVDKLRRRRDRVQKTEAEIDYIPGRNNPKSAPSDDLDCYNDSMTTKGQKMTEATKEAALPAMRTIDGHAIVQGLEVWDYNLDHGAVDLTRATERLAYQTYASADDVWFDVVRDKGGRSNMNPSRVWVRKPF